MAWMRPVWWCGGVDEACVVVWLRPCGGVVEACVVVCWRG